MSSDPKRGGWRAYATIFVVALLVRAAWGVTRFIRADDPTILEFPDEEQYWMMARSLWEGEGLRDELGFRATRMPLYPAVLAPFTAMPSGILAAKVLHWIVGAAAAALTGAAAGAWFDRRTGLLAGLLVAFDPFLTFSSSLLLTETPFVTALIALWWVLLPAVPHPKGRGTLRGGGRRDAGPVGMVRWVGVGILSALCVYLRESSLGLIVVAPGFVIACRRFEGKTILGTGIALVIVVAALIPWAARNQAVTSDWCWLTHRAGISLYDGVGPNATGASDLGAVKQSEAVRDLDEVAWNRYFLDQALAAIRHDPGRIARLAGSKLLRMWNPVPNVPVYRSGLARFLSAAWTIPTFALAAVGAILLSIGTKRGGMRAALFLLLPALYFSALHSLFVGSVRYRLAAVPMIEILAAVALAAIYRRVQAHGPAHSE